MSSLAKPQMDNITIECNFDADILKAMLRDDTIAKDDKKKLRNINKMKKNHNTIIDTYTWTNDEKYGRVYCNSLQMLPSEYRNGLLNNTCFELDMKNIHPTLLEQIGSKKYKMKTTELKKYIENREECLKVLSPNRAVAKEMYLTAGYGGDVPELEDYSTECKNILLRLKDDDEMKDLYKYAEKQYKKKNQPYKSLLHSFGSFVLSTYENRIMLSILDFIKQKNDDNCNIKIQIILHDGLIIQKNDRLNDEFIKELEEFIDDDTEWIIKLDKKDLSSKYQVDKQDYIVIQNDEDACDYLKQHYGDKIVRAGDDWYCHLQDTNHWSKGIDFVRAMIKGINFYMSGENADRPYSSTTGGMNKIIEYLELNCKLLFPTDIHFINNINKKTEGKVFYKDKFYDMKTKNWETIKANNLPIIYEDRLAPNLSSITEQDMKKYCDDFLGMFKTDEMPTMLKQLSRALAGHISDKTWTALCGWRNTGKGRLQKLLGLSFGSYITTVDAPLMKQSNKQDASERRWLITLNCHTKRIAFGNEVKSVMNQEPLLDGGDIKKVYASGGDDIVVRGHYSNEMIVKNNTTSFLSLNGIPKTDPIDAMNNCLIYKMPYKFVDNPTDIDEKKVIEYEPSNDPAMTKENINIMTKLIFEAYGAKITKSDYTKRMTDEADDASASNDNEPIMILKKRFRKPTMEEFQMKDDYTTFNEIKHIFKPAKMTDTSLGRFLKDRGYISTKKSVIKKNDTIAYKNMKIVITELQADEDEEDEYMDTPE